MSTNSTRHLRPRKKTTRTRLIAGIEAAARRLGRYAERAEIDLGEVGCAMSLRAYAVGLRQLSDFMGKRRMTIRPHLRHGRTTP